MADFRLSITSFLMTIYLLATHCVADSIFHSIWPFFNPDGQNSEGSSNQAITDALKADLKNDATKLFISRTEALKSTWYWYADLTPDLVAKYKSFPGVRHVVVPNNAPGVFRATPKRADGIQFSNFANNPEAPDQLCVLSLPPGATLADSKGYKYDSVAGKGVNIYVIDSGIAPSSPEFKSREMSWLFAGPFAAQDETDADIGEEGAEPSQQGHGTCMASIAMGNKDGVARAASLTVVKSDVFSNKQNTDASAEIWIDGLAKIYDDFAKKPASSKAVVSMSIGITGNPDQDYEACYATTIITLLKSLDEKDIPVTAAPGNDGTEIEIYSALLAKPLSSGNVPVPNLVVVGGFLVENGDFENDIRDKEIKIYGPADDSSGGAVNTPGPECASRDGKGYHKKNRGTSHATAAVSGLLAYFMSQGNTGAQAREALFTSANTRIKNGPPNVNNAVNGTS